MARSKGRAGRPWRRVRAQVLAACQTCWLCGKDIDLTLPATHRMSATVDHVVPISSSGEETDPANLRPAHKGCNSRRGNRMAAPAQPTSRRW